MDVCARRVRRARPHVSVHGYCVTSGNSQATDATGYNCERRDSRPPSNRCHSLGV